PPSTSCARGFRPSASGYPAGTPTRRTRWSISTTRPPRCGSSSASSPTWTGTATSASGERRSPREVVEGRQNVHPDDVQILLDLHVLVGLGHAAGERAVDEPGDAALAPEPRVGASKTDDGSGVGPAQRPGVGTQDAHHRVVRIAHAGRREV